MITYFTYSTAFSDGYRLVLVSKITKSLLPLTCLFVLICLQARALQLWSLSLLLLWQSCLEWFSVSCVLKSERSGQTVKLKSEFHCQQSALQPPVPHSPEWSNIPHSPEGSNILHTFPPRRLLRRRCGSTHSLQWVMLQSPRNQKYRPQHTHIR